MSEAKTELERQLYYRKRPIEWAVDYMDIDERTLRWSLNDGYEDHNWDGTRDPHVRLAQAVAEGGSRRIAVTSGVGTGKAQPLDSPVLTPDGWVNMGEISVGDEVITRDGSVTKVMDVYPQGERDIVKVHFNDGTTVRCDKDHLWSVQSPKMRYRDKGFITKKTSDINPSDDRKLFVPVVSPVRFNNNKGLPIHPYVLGALLGDGYMDKVFRFASADEQIIDRIRHLSREEIEVNHARDYDYIISDRIKYNQNRLKNDLEDLGVWGNHSEDKFIPNRYLYSSVEDRIELLRGLMDTDGTIRKNSGGTASFSSVSDELADDFVELVRGLGGVTRKRERTTNGGLGYAYRITVNMSINPFYISRKRDKFNTNSAQGRTKKIVNIEPDGRELAQCIRVRDKSKNYVTSGYTVTHNTFDLGWIPLWFADTYRPSFIATIAPKEDQLKLNLWKEIDSRFWEKFKELHPQAKLMSLEIRMKPDKSQDDDSGRSDWKIVGYVAGVGADETTAVKARGFHQEHMLIIFEEMTGISPAVVRAFKDTATAPHNVILGVGNADDENDPLSQFARKDSTEHIRISCYDHPNVVLDNPRFIPGATTQEAIDDLREDVGGDENDSRFQSRVRGLIPTVSSRSLYKERELRNAKEHLKEPKQKIEHTHRDGIEGFTEIYHEPDYNYLSEYILSMDVAGESDRDYHAAVLWNRTKRRPDAIVRMKGLGAGYIEACLSLCERFRIPHEEGKWAYPLMAWETNGVGQHFPRINIDHPDYDSLKDYPNIYFRKNLDASGASPRKTWGWYTTGGQSGNRHKIIEELKTWARELAYYPERMVSRYIYEEAKNFIKQEHRGKQRYMAARGSHDDLQMALGIAMVLDRATIEPIPLNNNQVDDEGRQLNERARRVMSQNHGNKKEDPFDVELNKF